MFLKFDFLPISISLISKHFSFEDSKRCPRSDIWKAEAKIYKDFKFDFRFFKFDFQLFFSFSDSENDKTSLTFSKLAGARPGIGFMGRSV